MKEEVRQETLFNAQVDRLDDLLQGPTLNDVWVQSVAAELKTLQELAPDQSAYAGMLDRIDGQVAQAINEAPDLDVATQYLHSGQKLAVIPTAEQTLVTRVEQALDQLATQPIDTQWVNGLQQLLGYVTPLHGRSTPAQMLTLEMVAVGMHAIPALIENAQVDAAHTLWGSLKSLVFDLDEQLDADARINSAVMMQLEDQERALAAARYEQVSKQLAYQLQNSCLHLSPSDAVQWLGSQRGLTRQQRRVLLQQVNDRVEGCLQRLAVIDADHALALREEAQQALGSARKVEVDPCAAHYLVGNGAQGSRSGACTDLAAKSGGDITLPELVVIPASDTVAKFAISRKEVSWRELDAFCTATGQCQAATTEKLPVTNLPVQTMLAYAAWLSELTGYTYRLPTLDEWQLAATGADDPNRNCRLEVNGIRRGTKPVSVSNSAVSTFGLLHVLGNVREVVTKGRVPQEAYVSVGGSFEDAIEHCHAQKVVETNPAGDSVTGFRLVREVS